MNFRNDIQGLRALAVIMVFIFHLSATALPGGFIGVDMFFVISGFLVSNIVYKKVNKGTFSLLNFYEGRLKRIVPAYLFLLFFVALIASFLFINTDILGFRKTLFWTILFNSNNYLATLDNYFGASSTENPLLHTWTLAVEMQFYFILPLVLMLIKNKKVLVSLLFILMISMTVYSTYGIYHGRSAQMYFSLISRMPEFLIGVIAAVLSLEDKKFFKDNSNMWGLLGALILVISAFIFDENTQFPGAIAFIPCIGTLLILLSFGKINEFLSTRPLVFIGEISYSLYLWHWPVMAFLRYHKNKYEFDSMEKIVVIILTITLSLISYYLIERPFRRSENWKFYIPFLCMGGGVASMLLICPAINKKIVGGDLEYMSPSFGVESHGTAFKGVQTLGDTSKVPEILLIGDSHALNMKKYVDIIGKRNGFSFRTLSNNTFPCIPGLDSHLIKDVALFETYKNLVGHVENELKTSKLIIVQFREDGGQWKDPILNFVKSLKPNQKIIFLQDFPSVDKNPVRVTRSILKNKEVENNFVIKRTAIHKDILKGIEDNPNCLYLKLGDSNVFDDAPFYNDTLMYYDKGHLNVYGARVYAMNTEERFMEAIKWGLNFEQNNRIYKK
ncbi:acyltransferase family protein [Sphingobacterium multivorum]|uniref:acyltransferase family protein n=1 Tax=Sphingobacterium multivorum TaxID=28454 RepID=UPI0028A66DFE|nr:acyltransferase family protein [Sphingobacterium multivorum]